jgi:hypothetical protein
MIDAIADGLGNIFGGLAAALKRQKTLWSDIEPLQQLDYDPNRLYFELPAEYLKESGLMADDLLLYCRQEFHDQFRFLQERVLENGVQGWVLGPPGTGKSATALAFAACVDHKEWTVTWIHLSRNEGLYCLRFTCGSRKESIDSDTSLKLLLNDSPTDKKHLLILDGFNTQGLDHGAYLAQCAKWRKKNRTLRRLVVVCSMASRGKTNYEDDKLALVEEFKVTSWLLEDFEAAVLKSETFFDKVKPFLDASPDLSNDDHQSRKDLVAAKYYYAGGSSRYMFSLSIEQVSEILSDGVESVNDISHYVTALNGDRSNNVINRLYSSYRNMRNRTVPAIISRFASSLLADRLGPELVRRLSFAVTNENNPSLHGQLFEIWFFACLRVTGLELTDSETELVISWSPSAVHMWPSTTDLSLLATTDSVWLKPSRWNTPSYDAVNIVKSENAIIFVQVTAGKEHDMDMRYLVDFIKAFRVKAPNFTVAKVKAIFVVEKSVKNVFKHSILNNTTLEKYLNGSATIEIRVLHLSGVKD